MRVHGVSDSRNRHCYSSISLKRIVILHDVAIYIFENIAIIQLEYRLYHMIFISRKILVNNYRNNSLLLESDHFGYNGRKIDRSERALESNARLSDH